VLKKQTEDANKKRKRGEEIEERRVKKEKTEDALEDALEDAPSPKKTRFADSEDQEAHQVAEFLLDESALTLFPTQKLKFEEGVAIKVEKKVKDRKKGSTTYRVAETTSTIFPPKAGDARGMKEAWMQNRAGKGASKKRTPWARDFLKGKKPENRSTVKRRYKPGRQYVE